jgi:hypothetical protein
MVSLVSLIVPILISAAIVFVASSVIHMVLTYHRTDMRRFAQEDDLLDFLRRASTPPGDYGAPHAGSPAAMRDPAFVEKMARGPVVFMTVVRGGSFSMGSSLTAWFGYSVAISFFAAYVTGRALGPEADYLAVFRLAGTTAFAGYALALPQLSIWYHRSWSTTIKSMVDGLIYGMLTGGTFGWLWPR